MKVFYHDDADGKMSAYIIRRYVDREVVCIAVDYDRPFPLHKIEDGEVVYIVDYSVKPDMMSRILDRTDIVVWIDHHKSAIDELVEYADLDGLRSTQYSGCELTWLNVAKGAWGHNVAFGQGMINGCPLLPRLIEDRDIWRFEYGDQSKWLHAAFELNGEPLPESVDWENMWDSPEAYINYGKELYEYKMALYTNMTDRWAYEAMFEGHKVLACNSPFKTSEIFGDRFKEYDMVFVYAHNGERYMVSLYSDKMEILPYAVKHGGGGHPRAAGFACDELPLRPLPE